MSSSNLPSSETTAFLADTVLLPDGYLGPRDLRQTKQLRLSPETLLIPVALATTLANGILPTTTVELTRQAVCRIWSASHIEPAITTDHIGGPSAPGHCDAPEVARYFAIVLAILGVTKGIISVAGYGIFSRVSLSYGRKPAFFLVLGAAIMSNSLIIGSPYMPDWLADWVLLVGTLLGIFSGPLHYLIDLYIVDKRAAEERTAALSKIGGWAGLGTCISYALGGTITTKSGNPLIVFHMAIAIYVAMLIYIASILPESFPEDKRNARSNMHLEPSEDEQPALTRFTLLHIFEPLKLLTPSRRLDGSRNWRLVWCTAHNFLLMLAGSYAWTALMVIATSKYHLSPQDTGFFFTSASVSRTICLMMIVPPLLRFLRPYYSRKVPCSSSAEENNEGLELKTSDHLHVHLAAASCVAIATFKLAAAASTTGRALILTGVCLGFTEIHGPMMCSLVVGSVNPLQQGEVLAAYEMVSHAGSVLSPILMGSTLTATVHTVPLLLFYIYVVIALISAALLFLIRDTDQYQKPHEA